MGMKFGLWFEPECISEDSDLYRAHPDWAIQIPGRQPNRSRYQLILDMGSGIDENFQLLDLCGKIYMPVLKDAVSVCKMTQFENLLRIWNKDKILEKTEKLHLPFHMDSISSESYVEQLVWSELGDYIRKLLRKEYS